MGDVASESPSTEQGAGEERQPSGILLQVYGRSDVGRVREHNEDNFLLADLTKTERDFASDEAHSLGRAGAVFGVCDGMGGAAAGEVASQLAVDIIYDCMVGREASGSREELARRLVRSVQEAGARIFGEARADRSRRGMGTTSTIATLIDERLFLAQVGDSRGYILRDGELVQVTRDQSLVNQLIEAGQLTEEEAETFEHNNIILQALGTSESVQVDLTYVDLREEDVLVLCSDGLSGMIRSEDILGVLASQDDLEAACDLLIARANEAGGHDNVTVVVVKFSGPGLREPLADDEPVGYQKYSFSTVEDSFDEAGDGGSGERATVTEHMPAVGRGGVVDGEDSGDDAPSSSGRGAKLLRGGALAPEESVAVPLDGLPPKLVGVIIMAGVALILAMGFYLLN